MEYGELQGPRPEPTDADLELEEEYKHPIFANLEKGNIVDQIESLPEIKETNATLYADIHELFTKAKASMEKWEAKYKKALHLAKLQPTKGTTEITTKDFPFKDASLAMLPFVLEAMLDFSSRASPELVWTDKIVKCKVNGEDDKDKSKNKRSERVADFMNYQAAEMIPHFREGQDRGVLAAPCVGTFYKHTYWDFEEQLVCSDLLMADTVVFDMNCEYFDEAPDKFIEKKYTRNEIIGFIRGEQGWNLAESELEEDKEEFDVIQAWTWIDIDQDGLKEPYYIVMWPESEKIVCVYPRYDDDTVSINDDEEVIKIKEVETFTQYQFLPDPEGGPMGMGWGILLGPMFTALNTNLRQMVDAGTLHNSSANSGIIAIGAGDQRGNRQQSGPIKMAMGELTPVSMGSMRGDLAHNVVQMPFSGPSQSLFQLMEYLAGAARNMITAANQVEANQGEAASLYLARLQQGLKVPNSIVMRIYSAAKKEFEKIADLNYRYHDSKLYNKVLDREQKAVMVQDFNPDDCDISLVADASQGSDIERVARAEVNYQMALNQAQTGASVISLREATIDLLNATRTPDIERLAPEPSNEPSPEQQLAFAEQAKEAELKERDQALREQGQQIQTQKMAMEAAKAMSELGLKQDKQEAEIQRLYVQSLKDMVDMGLGVNQAIPLIENVERKFITRSEGGQNGRQAPTSNTSAIRPMVRQPGNQGPG